jgi:nicotinamidase-related amidase
VNDRPVLLALHYQNDVLHPEGRIRVGLAKDDPTRAAVIASAGLMLREARRRTWPIVHVRIAFREDYADCPRNTPIFRRTIESGAVRDGQWGAEFFASLQPCASPLEFVVTHTRISAFAGTPLQHLLTMLRATRLLIGGVATHSVVEGTARDAADRGFEVWIAADACSAAGSSVHDAALQSMSLIASVTTAQAAYQALEQAP